MKIRKTHLVRSNAYIFNSFPSSSPHSSTTLCGSQTQPIPCHAHAAFSLSVSLLYVCCFQLCLMQIRKHTVAMAIFSPCFTLLRSPHHVAVDQVEWWQINYSNLCYYFVNCGKQVRLSIRVLAVQTPEHTPIYSSAYEERINFVHIIIVIW